MRALSALGNGTIGTTSRPSTPTPMNTSISTISGSGAKSGDITMNTQGFFSKKLNKIIADRQSVVLQQSQKPLINSEEERRLVEVDISQNGKNDSWQEDQEVLVTYL